MTKQISLRCGFFFISVLCLFISAYGQRPTGSSSTPSSGRPNNKPIYEPDTTIIESFTLKDIDLLTPYADTIFEDFEKYAEQRSFDNGALNLGNHGSASQRIIYQPFDNIYTDNGFHQYDIYKKDIFKFPIYSANRTFNELSFSPLKGSNNFFARAKFANAFKNNITLSIDYNRVTQEGFYDEQNTKATQLGVCLGKTNASETHKIFFSFVANNFNETHNGGITDEVEAIFDSIPYNFGDLRKERASVPVYTGSSPGQTRHQNFAYGIDNYLFVDSSRFLVHHHIHYEHGYYKYSDETTTPPLDSVLYKSFLVDSRGIRYFNKISRLTNQIDIGLNVKNIKLNVGLKYVFLNNFNTIETEKFHDLALVGQLKFDIGTYSSLIGDAEIGIGDNVGNIKLAPMLRLNPIKGISIDAYAKILRYNPTLLQQKVYVTDQLIYENNFSKVNEFLIGGMLNVDKLNLQVRFNSGLITDPVRMDINAIPVQLDGTTEYIQASFKHRLKWKFIGFDNSLVYQEFSDNIYNLPQLYSIHNLYVQTLMFKRRLNVQIGALLYNYNYDGSSRFMPVTGQFYPSEKTLERYYYTEAYINLKIDRFRMFFKMDNLTDLIIKQPHFQITNYPQFDSKFRMGVTWQLFD